MLAKRIIPCLDVRDGRTVKGVKFENIRDAGDPVELASYYSSQGADELVFLDITATIEKRKTFYSLIKNLAVQINIPFTVGGGIVELEDISALLESGADKVSINSAAFRNPELLENAALRFGSQCIVLAIDTKREADGEWYVFLSGGRVATGRKAIDWASEAVDRGVGEILLTSMDNDGIKSGYALDITSRLSDTLNVPVIASGGAGTMPHFLDAFEKGHAAAALAASVFHFGEIRIPDLKKYLLQHKIPVRYKNES